MLKPRGRERVIGETYCQKESTRSEQEDEQSADPPVLGWDLYSFFNREEFSDCGRNDYPDDDHVVDAFPDVNNSGLQCRSVDVADHLDSRASAVATLDSCCSNVPMTACGIGGC